LEAETNPRCFKPTDFVAAIASNGDMIIAGDKDFLESGAANPQILTAAEFV
jgi:predicted nucleic acid-binding protein